MRERAAGLDEHVAHRPLERQVGEPVAVQMPELPLPEPELDAAEAVLVHGHALPACDLALDPGAAPVHRRGCTSVLFSWGRTGTHLLLCLTRL